MKVTFPFLPLCVKCHESQYNSYGVNFLVSKRFCIYILNIFHSQIVLSLYYVHQNQILHRDLKTQNIFLTRSLDHVKIGDFGISKILSTKSKAFTVVGTPCYISPELCEGGHSVDSRWALQFLLLQYHSNCFMHF